MNEVETITVSPWRCCWCKAPVPSLLAECEEPECIAKAIEREAAFVRREDV